MSEHEEIWLPLVDEPIGSIVAQIQADDPEIERLVGSPRRILAFHTFAYIRVGVKLGELLVDNDVPPYDGTDNWIELRLRSPENREAIARVRAVADEIAADPRYGEDEQLGPDQAARDRFRDFAPHVGFLVPDQADEEDRAEAGEVSARRASPTDARARAVTGRSRP